MKGDTAVEKKENRIPVAGENSKKKKKLKKSKGVPITGNKGRSAVQGVGRGVVQGVGRGAVQGVGRGAVQSIGKGTVQGVRRGRIQSVGRGGVQGVGRGEVQAGGKGQFNNKYKKNKKKNKNLQKRKNPAEWSNEKLEVTEELSKQIVGRVNERNSRSLYVRFPSTLTVAKTDDVKKCLGEVIADGEIRFPRTTRTKLYNYGFVEFKNEAIIKMKKEEISQVEVDGEKFYADLIADKSKTKHVDNFENFDAKRLHVSNLPASTTRMDLRNLFSTSRKIDFSKQNKTYMLRDFAFINYETKEEALRVFNNTKNLKINGQELRVNFAKFKMMKTVKIENKADDAKKVDKPSEKNGKRKNNNNEFKPSNDADISPPLTKKIKVKEDTEIKETNSDADEMEVKETDDVSEDQVGDDDDEGDDDSDDDSDDDDSDDDDDDSGDNDDNEVMEGVDDSDDEGTDDSDE